MSFTGNSVRPDGHTGRAAQATSACSGEGAARAGSRANEA